MGSLCSFMPRAGEALFSSVVLRQRPFVKIRPPAIVAVPPTPKFFATSVAKSTQQVRSSELVALEYADLNIPYQLSEELGPVRIRQHVNPLRASLMIPAEVPNWNKVFKDATLPLMVDIGCGSGRFLMWLAKRYPDSKNYLGLEIREKLVKRAEYWVNELALDPHFKKKHWKRRLVQQPLVDSVVDSLVPGGQVLIQSDVREVALDVRNYFDAKSEKLLHVNEIDPDVLCDHEGWLLMNPMGIRTEREIHAEHEGAKIYRRMYQKQR